MTARGLGVALAVTLAAGAAQAQSQTQTLAPAGIIRDFTIIATTPAFGGATPPGAAGPYELISAVAHGALDPRAAANAGIADLSGAPRAADGRVDYATDVVILRPVHAADAKRLLVYEVVNRGRKLTVPVLLGADPAGTAVPGTDFPSLLATGATIVWSGWQGDLPLNGTAAIAGSALLGTRFPIAHAAGGASITGMSREEFIPDYAGGPATQFPLSYPPAEANDRAGITFTARQSWMTRYGREDAGRPDYAAPSAPVTDWHYVATPSGATAVAFTPPATVPGPENKPVPPDAGTIYSFVYRAKDPMVLGTGFAGVRDLIAFLRGGRPDAAGHANPLADLVAAHPGRDTAIGVGISQSGRFLRDFLYQGFNDADGHAVFDGLMPIISGGRRTWVNARFAQPGRWSKQHEDHWQQGDQFPFTYAVRHDPLGGRTDGLLRACAASATCPRIMQVDGAFEWWGGRASLVVTDGRGHDIQLPPNVRYYEIAGTKHGGGDGIGAGVAAGAAGGGACRLPDSPISEAPEERALLRALIAWTGTGKAPPPSAYPTIAGGTAVAPGGASHLPGGLRGQLNQLALTHYADALPALGGFYTQRVPAAGADGNERAGIRPPDIMAPLASYTGWNIRAAGHAEGDGCLLSGAAVQLPADKSHAAPGDTRPTLAELYKGRDDYQAKLRAAAEALVRQGYLLPLDAQAVFIAPAARVSATLVPSP